MIINGRYLKTSVSVGEFLGQNFNIIHFFLL